MVAVDRSMHGNRQVSQLGDRPVWTSFEQAHLLPILGGNVSLISSVWSVYTGHPRDHGGGFAVVVGKASVLNLAIWLVVLTRFQRRHV